MSDNGKVIPVLMVENKPTKLRKSVMQKKKRKLKHCITSHICIALAHEAVCKYKMYIIEAKQRVTTNGTIL